MVTNPRLLPVRNAREQLAVAGRSSVLVTCNPQTQACYVDGKGGECVMERDEWDHYRSVLCAPLERRAWVVSSLIHEDVPSCLKFVIENAPEGTECPVFGGPQVYLDRLPGYFRVVNLFVPVPCRRAGMATRLMREILDLTGMSKLPVYVDAVPFGSEAMTQEELFGFYRALGFERVPGHAYAMVRQAGQSEGDPLAGGEGDGLTDDELRRILGSVLSEVDAASEGLRVAQSSLSVDDYGENLESGLRKVQMAGACLANLLVRLAKKEESAQCAVRSAQSSGQGVVIEESDAAPPVPTLEEAA